MGVLSGLFGVGGVAATALAYKKVSDVVAHIETVMEKHNTATLELGEQGIELQVAKNIQTDAVLALAVADRSHKTAAQTQDMTFASEIKLGAAAGALDIEIANKETATIKLSGGNTIVIGYKEHHEASKITITNTSIEVLFTDGTKTSKATFNDQGVVVEMQGTKASILEDSIELKHKNTTTSVTLAETGVTVAKGTSQFVVDANGGHMSLGGQRFVID